eukprot:COSAG01_NODE_41605_length_449_cov_1.265714_1_plen_71_part_10
MRKRRYPEDRQYQHFLRNSTMCAPITSRPLSDSQPWIKANDSGLIVDEWNPGPNGFILATPGVKWVHFVNT